MSIATEITRIQQAKADIKTAIEAKGVTVPSSATIDTYDDYVSQISGGGAIIPQDFESWECDFLGRPKNFVLKSGVGSIPPYFQYYNSSLTACTIPSGTSIDSYAFAHLGTYMPTSGIYQPFDVSGIDLRGMLSDSKFSYVFSNSYLKGTITIPNSVLTGATSGNTSSCLYLFSSAMVYQYGSTSLNVNVDADNVVIPKSCFGFSYTNVTSDGLNLTISGTPSYLSSTCIGCSTGATVTFVNCINPPDGASYTSSSSNPFFRFKGTMYVPSAGLSAWQTKYPTIASQIQAIPNS